MRTGSISVMRWHIKRTKLLLALIPIISIVFYILTANHNIFADQSFSAFDIYQFICDRSEPVPGKNSPADYTAAENFAIANDVYLKADAVGSVTEGTVTAMGFYKQVVANEHIRVGDHIFNESVSLSSIASVAEQRYFKDGALLYRKGNASSNTVKSWANGVTELTVNTYRQRYGLVPQEITKYAVNSDSIKSGSLVSENGDGTFTYELVMNAMAAQEFSRYEMMTFAGVTAYPEFLSCRLIFTIDDSWHIRTLESYDTYKIDLMGGVKCDSHLLETYSFENVTMPERAQIFIDYVPTGNTGNIDNERGPADYLNEAYGDYISGKRKLALAAEFALKEDKLPLRAEIDITGNDFRFALGDEVFAAYTGDKVYVALGDNKYTFALSDANGLLSSTGAGDKLPTDMTAADLLDILFADYTMTETDTHVYIRMPFTLMGIDLDVNMGLKKEGERVQADTIQATIRYKDIEATADVAVQDAVTLPALNISEYTSLAPLLRAVNDTVALPAYRLQGNVTVNINDTSLAVDADARLRKKEGGLEAQGSVTAFGIPVSFAYTNDTAYVSARSFGVSAKKEDFPKLQQALGELLGDGAAQAADVLPQLLPYFLPADTSLSGILHILSDLTYQDGTMTLSVTPAQGAPYTLTVTHGDLLQTLRVEGCEVQGVTADARFTLTEGETAPVAAEGNYTDVNELLPYVSRVRELMDSLTVSPAELLPFVKPLVQTLSSDTLLLYVSSGSISLPQEVQTKQSDGSILTETKTLSETFTASVTVRMPKEDVPFALACTVNVSGQTFHIVWQNGTVYLQTGAIACKLAAADVQPLLRALTPMLGDASTFLQNISYLLGEGDVQKAVATIQKASDILGSLANAEGGAAGVLAVLGELIKLDAPDFEAVKAAVSSLSVQNGEIVFAPQDLAGVSLTLRIQANEEYLTGIQLRDMQVKDATVNATVALTPDAPLDLQIDDAAYYDAANLQAFVPALQSLLNAPVVRAQITGGTLNTALLSGSVRGSAELAFADALSLQADLSVRGHTVRLLYDGETICVQLNDIKLAFTLDDIDALRAQIRELTKKEKNNKNENGGHGENNGDDDIATILSDVLDELEETVQTVTLLQNALGGKTLAELLSCVQSFAPSGKDDNGFTADVRIDDFVAKITLSPTADGLAAEIDGFGYGTYVQNSTLSLRIEPANMLSYVDFTKDDCVRLAQLQSYIRPVVDLGKQSFYTVSFDGIVTASNGGVTKIAQSDARGELRIERTQGFINAYAHIPLSGKAGEHDVTLYLLDGTDYTQNKTLDKSKLAATVVYNGFAARIDYASALGMVGSLCDILNVRLPESAEKELLATGYVHYETNVFRTMDIKGLDGLRDKLSSLFGTGEDVEDLAQGGMNGMLGMISDDMIDDVLRGVSLSVDGNGMLRIRIDNGIFTALQSKNIATVTVAHDGEALTRVSIDNLVARGDTVTFVADFSFDPFVLPDAPQNAVDFTTADDLLYDLIRTADMRKFEIDGNINLTIDVGKFMSIGSFISFGPDIPVHGWIQILPDGSTVAAIKLSVPKYGTKIFGYDFTLTQTDSYLYFADNRLYFVVDVYESGKYSRTDYRSATVDEFLSDPMPYVFDMVRLGSTIESLITDSFSKGLTVDLQNLMNDPSSVFKQYSYSATAGEHTFVLGLKELLDSSDFADVHLRIGNKNGVLNALHVDTTFVKGITVTLDASVTNLDTNENDEPIASELSDISFGKCDKFTAYETSNRLDELKGSLALLFPVEAAEVAAESAQDAAAKALAAADKAKNASLAVEKAETALAEAKETYDEAQKKSDGMQEGVFGYELVQAQAAHAYKEYVSAQEDLAAAQNARKSAAKAATDAALASKTAAENAAAAANAALNRDKSLDHEGITDVRAYAAAANAAIAAIDGINACDDALDAAYEAAQAAGDEELCEQIAALQTETEDNKKTVASLVFDAANRACESAVAVVQTAQAQTQAAHEEAKQDSTQWITATNKANETLSAIAALQRASMATTQAAQMSGNETWIAQAVQTAATAQAAQVSAAKTAVDAAIDAANGIAAIGKATADEAVTQANAKEYAHALESMEKALENAQSARTAADCAAKASAIADDETLRENAAKAEQTATQAAAYMGEHTLTAAKTVANGCADASTQPLSDITALENAATLLDNAARSIAQVQNARQYVGEAVYDEALRSVTQNAGKTADSVLKNSVDPLTTLTNALQTDIASTQNTAAELQKKMDAATWIKPFQEYDGVKNAANALASQADRATHLSTIETAIADNAYTVYVALLPYLDDDACLALQTLLQTVLGDENNGLIAVQDRLYAATQQAVACATTLGTQADGLYKGLTHGSDVDAAKAAAENAAQQAESAQKAAENVATPLNSLALLRNRLA